MKCGIIGLPNVGKSTLFNCLTSLQIPAENYPFCTVEPNIGIVKVPDTRLTELARISQSEKMIHTSMEFVDIAGLVKGAHKGEGLGNRFLSHIREVDALIHVVRFFEDKSISHVQGGINPLRDIQLIDTELLMADIETLEKRKEKFLKLAKGSKDKTIKEELDLINKLLHTLLDEEMPARNYKSSKEEHSYFYNLHLLTSKPILYVCNTDESSILKINSWEKPSSKEQMENSVSNQKQKSPLHFLQTIKQKHPSLSWLPICANMEAQISSLDSIEEKQSFLSALGWKEEGLSRLIKQSYQLLNLITFFTSGKKETRAWTIKKGTKAPEAGGKIHSDFEKGFIRAEVYSFADMKKFKSETNLKANGRYRQEGRNYIVQDGDVMLFRFNV